MAVNANTLINFGTSGLNVGDIVYSAVPLSSPTYLPLNNDTSTYLTSSYPILGGIYADKTVAYSKSVVNMPFVTGSVDFWNILYGNKKFIAWTASGALLTSVDATSWTGGGIGINSIAYSTTALQEEQTGRWKSMAYGNGKLVAIRSITRTSGTYAYQGGSAVSYDDGATWIYGALPAAGASGVAGFVAWTDVIYVGDKFVAYGSTVQSAGVHYLVSAHSVDGVNWQASYNPAITFSTYPYVISAAYGLGTLIGTVRPTAAASSTMFRSTNKGLSEGYSGITALPATIYANAIAFGNTNTWVVVGASGTNTDTNVYYYSVNLGVTWTAGTLPASLNWTNITYANGFFLASGEATGQAARTDVVATSPDGITWTLRTMSSGNFRPIVGGGKGLFISVAGTNSYTMACDVITLGTAATNFTLPFVSSPTGLQAYIRAG